MQSSFLRYSPHSGRDIMHVLIVEAPTCPEPLASGALNWKHHILAIPCSFWDIQSIGSGCCSVWMQLVNGLLRVDIRA